MDSSCRTLALLAAVPPFSALDRNQVQCLYGFTALKVLAKGEAATVAGASVDELCIVVSGRIAELGGLADAEEFGHGVPLQPKAFFTQRPAAATLIALRETVLLTLSWDDLTAAFDAHPDLLASCFEKLAREGAIFSHAPAAPSRLALCAAGAKGRLDPGLKDAFVSALESCAEVRLLRRESFGSLALDAPETAHWLQEQEIEFDVTVVVADGADADFARKAIEEADEILFVAAGGSSALTAFEQHALDRRGKDRCRLILAKGKGISLKNAAEWIAPRPFRSTQLVDFASPAETLLMAMGLLGKGNAIAAASHGVYAAAILGALQAFEASGAPALCLAAGGSAILPAGLLACGASLAETEAVFRVLADKLVWKRSARLEAGLFEANALDSALASTLPAADIALSIRPFAAVSLSLSNGGAKVHRRGRMQELVRGGLTPPGMLLPVITEEGDILLSGENEVEALAAAARRLSASPLMFLYPSVPSLGPTDMTYRQAAGGSSFRLPPFQSPVLDKRLRLETVLGALSDTRSPAFSHHLISQSFAIPIPDGISPMDWEEWERLRDGAFDWTSSEIEARGLAQS